MPQHNNTFFILVSCTALLGACSTETPIAPNDRLEALLQIAAKCKLDPSSFKLGEDGNIIFKPPADSDYEDVDCAITEVKKSPFSFKLGFVGNEAIAPEKQK
jgi:hypothetical protein